MIHGQRGSAVMGNFDGFWTDGILRKFHYFNYQRGNQALAQNVFEEARAKTKGLYAKRQNALKLVKEAQKSAN